LKKKAPVTRRRARAQYEPFEATRRDSMGEWLEDALRQVPDLELRRMFGGVGIFSADTMFGILHGGRVYLKTDGASRAELIELGSEPFQPRPGAVLTSYYEVPADVLDDDEQLLLWGRRALDVAQSQPPKAKPQGRVSPEQILDGQPAAIQLLAERLRRLVLTVAPQATEAGYPGWRLIGYRSPHYFCFIAPQADHVRLGFEHGQRLSDPHGLLELMGKQVRFARLLPGKRLPIGALRALIQAALITPPKGRAAR
jgi:TfoX/Sxy family transcriptional regulator of competence genes